MTGASHSSVKRYRELARNSPQKRTRTRAAARRPASAVRGAQVGLDDRERGVRAGRARRSVRCARWRSSSSADGADVFIVSRKTLESMSPVQDASRRRRHRAALAAVAGRCARVPRTPLVVVAHDVQDPGNVGGIMRTAEAAGATAFIATAVDGGSARLEGAARLDGKRAATADRARRDRRRARRSRTARHRDQRRSCRAAASRCSRPISEKPSALILGGEGPGLPDEICCGRSIGASRFPCTSRSNRSTSASPRRWCCTRHFGRRSVGST